MFQCLFVLFCFPLQTEDEYRTKIARQEASDEQGVVSGSYSIADANGIARVVNYIAGRCFLGGVKRLVVLLFLLIR